MKFPISNRQSCFQDCGSEREFALTFRKFEPTHVGCYEVLKKPLPSAIGNAAAFTLMEIAICLAIIGFALVAIIGVLPIGLTAQQASREETIVNQDATVFINAIRGGARGLDYLTNYVYAIVNTGDKPSGQVGYLNPALAGAMNVAVIKAQYPSIGNWYNYLTSGSNIVGLLSTPERQDLVGLTYTNHIVAYVRSLSGLAAEKPPQDNQIMIGDTFGYRIYCVNRPTPMLTGAAFGRELANNLNELRLTFYWPQLPNGKVGPNRQTFRATIAGQLNAAWPGSVLFFYQPQIFTNAP